MEYLKHKIISTVALVDLKLSESELEVFESSIDYLLSHSNEKEIYNLTGGKLDEIKSIKENLVEIIRATVLEKYLPERYK